MRNSLWRASPRPISSTGSSTNTAKLIVARVLGAHYAGLRAGDDRTGTL